MKRKKSILRLLKARGLFVTSLLAPMIGYAATTEISDLVIADVTDRSLSIIFTTSEKASPALAVFTDEGATAPATNIEVVQFPVHTGDPAISGQFRPYSIANIVNGAKSRFIVKLEVQGLEPETNYYLKPSVTSESSGEETVCPDAGSDYCPRIFYLRPSATSESSDEETACPDTDFDDCQGVEEVPLIIETAKGGVHAELDISSGNTQMYLNDQIIIDTEQGNIGDLVIIAVEGARYPLSAFVGDGIEAPRAIADLNNLYSESDNTLLRIEGSMPDGQRGDFGEAAQVRLYQGIEGVNTLYRGIGINSGKGQAVPLNKSALGDCNLSGTVNGYDQLLLNWVVDNGPLAELQRKIAFHPALCDLYKEGGIESLSMAPEINEEDLTRLKEFLVGSKTTDELPEEPVQ
ncbi:hypothetical protein MJO52_19020 [Microbulbifer variabilis]|uniref:Uncharacterized protein n=1 Tax=Microbulbifer variabilis TaxID=266805 RepID=A0ABY4VA19_9GAMM|nr:hypothetical protein [Microbulbifer variabilis]USD21131.1 hypothetical protein MJO52_19020 [Microbulbifer variabilis]